MQTLPIDLRVLGYPGCYVKPLDEELFEVTPMIHGDWDIWSSSKIGFTANDMYEELSNLEVISEAAGLPTLMHYFNNQNDIPESWIGNRIFGLRGIVIHHDGDNVSPYLDCRDPEQTYIGYFRLKGCLCDFDAFIAKRC